MKKDLAITKIIKELRSKGFGLDVDATNVIVISFTEEEGNEDETLFNISVYPSRRWKKAVDEDDQEWLRNNWEGKYTDKGDVFESVMIAHQLDLGSVGGGNFDYGIELDKIQYQFCFWGNPWHI